MCKCIRGFKVKSSNGESYGGVCVQMVLVKRKKVCVCVRESGGAAPFRGICMAKHNFLVSLIKLRAVSSLFWNGHTFLATWQRVCQGEVSGTGELLVYEIEVRGKYTSVFQTHFQCFK